MENGQANTDYYAVLKVNPDCDGRILELAYHYFAKMYHPDNPETADPEKFNAVVEAYRTLRDPDKRAEYNRSHGRSSGTFFQMPNDSGIAIDEKSAVDDAEAHARILLYLYKKRRENAGDAGVIGWYVQEMLGCSEEIFQFHLWYLKNKRFIEMTEHGTIAITIEGVDHVFSTFRPGAAEPLRIEQGQAPQT